MSHHRTTDSIDEFQRAEMLMYFRQENESLFVQALRKKHLRHIKPPVLLTESSIILCILPGEH